MIRFYSNNIFYIEYENIDCQKIKEYFSLDYPEGIVCVLNSGQYAGSITRESFFKYSDVYDSIIEEYLVLDENIWQNGRRYFIEQGELELIPVLNRKHELVTFAWQEMEANRELRMLQELGKYSELINFHDLHPNCKCVTIHGCNELAWFMTDYLMKIGMTVQVDGDIWNELKTWDNCSIPEYGNYEIWAEGVIPKKISWKQQRLRNVSAEFECIDEIYEANIKAGKITDADGNVNDLLNRLCKENHLILRGTGTLAHNAYDWLLANGIDICAFQSDKISEARKQLFGKPILKRKDIFTKYEDAVIIECSFKHSAWGFGEVDKYAYEGYERNKNYLLLRDYIEIPENYITHIISNKKMILTGDIRICNRLCRWWKAYIQKEQEIAYWDLLKEGMEFRSMHMSVTECDEEERQDVVYILVSPQPASKAVMTQAAAGKYDRYIEKLKAYGINDYTDYFSEVLKLIYMEPETRKYEKKELCPKGILLGAIPAYSGNALIGQSLAGHPQIVMIEGGKYIEKGAFLRMALYSYCIRLAEEKACDILSVFWKLYNQEAGADTILRDFPYKEKFNQKMKELLLLSDFFSSQELFVMFHIAYETMYGREISNIENIIIYWEPHHWQRKYVRNWAYWLCSEQVKCFILNVVRNRYICAGSSIRLMAKLSWRSIYNCMFSYEKIKYLEENKNLEQCTIKFEDLKCHPKDILTKLCEWIGVPFSNSLLETTYHGEKAYFVGKITGFDIKPAYNLYEEFFSAFDRLRIIIIACSFQKKHGYPYVSSLEFSRRELQEMFFKNYRWEEMLESDSEKNEDSIWHMQNYIRFLLWEQRFIEIMDADMDETL